VNHKWHYVIFFIGLMIFEMILIQRVLEGDELWLPTFLSVVLMLLGVGIVAKDLKKNLSKDQLTGLITRKHFFEELLMRELKRAQRTNKPITVLLLDLNDFKSINDNYGHNVGDEVLKEFAEVVKKSIRESDIAVRFGGDEMLVVLPETDEDGAEKVLERIRENLSKVSVRGLKIGVTGGIASWKEGEDFDLTIQRADEDLYRRKKTEKSKNAN
jgi:two-component system cell cycle response regulator